MSRFLDAVSDALFVARDDGTVRVLVSDFYDLGFDLGAAEAEGVKLVWRTLTRCYLAAVVASTVLGLFVFWAGLILLSLSWLLKTYVVQSMRHRSGREVSLEKGEYDAFYGQLSRSISRRAAVSISWAARILIPFPFCIASLAALFLGFEFNIFPF